MEYLNKDLGEQIAEGLCNSAECYRLKNDFHMSKKLYLEALKWREELLMRDKEYYLPLIAKILNSLAVVSMEGNESDLAVKYYKKSIYVRKMLRIENDVVLANNYADLADLCRREYNYTMAKEFYNKALDIYLKVSSEDFYLSHIRVLNIYNHLGVICSAENQYEEREDAYIGALTIYKGLVKNKSNQYKEEYALKLFDLATLYFKNQRQNRAGEIYLYALDLLLELDDMDANRYIDECAMIFYRLGEIYTSQLEYSDALASYRTALKYYIAMAEEQPLKYGSYVATVFKSLASLHKKQGNIEAAQYFHLKVVDIYWSLTHYNELEYALQLASTIIDGVIYYQQHSLSLYEAELILEEYYEGKKGDELLDRIYHLREDTFSKV